jgi:hypothetical protein
LFDPQTLFVGENVRSPVYPGVGKVNGWPQRRCLGEGARKHPLKTL